MSNSDASSSQRSKRYLLWTIDGNIVSYTTGLLAVGKALRNLGHHVITTSCQGAIERCPSIMGLRQILSDEERGLGCASCSKNTSSFPQLTGWATATIDSEIREMSRQLVPETLCGEELYHFSFQGHQLGKYAFSDFTLERKRFTLQDLSTDENTIYRSHLRSAVAGYLAFKQILTTQHFDGVFVYNNYSNALGVHCAAKESGVEYYTVTNGFHGYVDKARLVINRGLTVELYRELIDEWPAASAVGLIEDEYKLVGQDLINRFAGNMEISYSPTATNSPERLYDELGISRDKKTITALTSSLDERIAFEAIAEAHDFDTGYQDTFSDQSSWLRHLAQWSSERDDVQVIIRIHPREDANRRESQTSEHLQRLKEALSDVQHPNLVIIWPQDPLSTYDILKLSDLVLISWTTVGHEAARCGVPTIAINENAGAYGRGGVIEIPRTPEAYFEAIESALQESVSNHSLLQTWRWYHFYHLKSALKLSIEDLRSAEPVASSTLQSLNDLLEYQAPASRSTFLQSIRRNTRARLSIANELNSLQQEYARFAIFLCINKCIEHINAIDILISNDIQKSLRTEHPTLIVDPDGLKFIYGENQWEASYPLARKISTIISSINDELMSTHSKPSSTTVSHVQAR